MKVGSLVFATDQGLGVLAKQFYDNGVITHPVIVRHGSRVNHTEWYPDDTPQFTDLKNAEQRRTITEYLSKLDAVLFLETPFVWELITSMRQRYVKTALMVMYECMPKVLPEKPDLILCPSKLDHQYFPHGYYIPVPAPSDIPWVERNQPITTFVHNTGHGGLKGRNGTAELLAATELLKTNAEILIRSQNHFYSGYALFTDGRVGSEYQFKNPRVKVSIGTLERRWLYEDGDVFLFPEKFNGLSLPLQEAHAAGMVVCTTDRFPNSDWLPSDPLIPVKGYRPCSVSARTLSFKEAVLDPKDIANAIDRLYGTDPTELSRAGKVWAEENSWDVLKPEYLRVLS